MSFNPIVIIGDVYDDTTDGGDITVTSVDPWNKEVGYTKTFPNMTTFSFEVVKEIDFLTAITSGTYSIKSVKHMSGGSSMSGDCWHKWETYVGFSWTYKFCDRCGIKKDDIK